LWLLVVFRLLLPVAPPSPFSIFNVARFAPASPGSATLQVEIEPAKISVRPNAEPDSLGTPVSDPARLDLSLGSRRVGDRRSSLSPGIDVRLMAAWLWLVGAAGYLLFIFRRHSRVSSHVRSGRLIID